MVKVDGLAPRIFKKNKWLILRRLCQFLMLAIFLTGPYLGFWIMRGNLASSTFLDTINLTDPFIALQSVVAGHPLATPAIGGALLVLAIYLLLGGRSFCSWVCPINPITDGAAVLRDRLGIKSTVRLSKYTRYALIPVVLIVSYLLSEIAFEAVNPITMLHRGLLFGMGASWVIIAFVFIFDLFVLKHGWCGHICPVGAFYGLIGRFGLIKVSAGKRDACTNCGDCFRVCPEPHVIAPALFPKDPDTSPLISNADCINCGRCIDFCEPEVFRFTHTFDRKVK